MRTCAGAERAAPSAGRCSRAVSQTALIARCATVLCTVAWQGCLRVINYGNELQPRSSQNKKRAEAHFCGHCRPCGQAHPQHQCTQSAHSAKPSCRDRSICCAAERPVDLPDTAGVAAAELQPPTTAAAPAADLDRLRVIRERIKQQRASQPPTSYSLHATQVL